MIESIEKKLDLQEYIKEFKSFFARDKELFIEGDINLHKKFIDEVAKVSFTPPKPTKNLDSSLMYLKKQGILKLYEIFEFVKIVWYFNYLKKQNFPSLVIDWLLKVQTPPEVLEVASWFDEKANLKPSVDERFEQIQHSLKRNKDEIKDVLKRLSFTKKLQPYLVDTQIHYIDDSETLLVRGGFNHVLKGSVVARSSAGFFYVLPEAIEKLKKRQATLISQKEELIYEYERKISSIFSKFWKFLNYINREFDRFDHYQARVNFAKSKELEFLAPKKGKEIVLKNFAHPALKDPKLINLDFSKKLLLITGVNAGGKTMLLKSILSAVFMSKYLLPMRVDANNSTICSFKEIIPIIDDPQSVKNDISTFAGRMSEFSKLFAKQSFITGVDEIELGTDADEAATLFKVILENILKKDDVKVVVTTHHKRLASMMATDDEVELLAALYDEEQRKPTFEFLKGTIGKSYAFETALRYGISPTVVASAKELYGEDKEKVNELIQINIDLELKLKSQLKDVENKKQKYEKLNEQLSSQKQRADEELNRLKSKLNLEYKQAIDEAKQAAKSKDKAQIHRLLNKANQKKKEAQKVQPQEQKIELKVGDKIKYKSGRGEILSIQKNMAFITCDGMKMKVPLKDLKRSGNPPKPKKQAIRVERPQRASVQLDLHGQIAEEAVENLDKYLSDALITGYDEVLVYHGVGTGKLAFAVKEFLKTHPKVRSFSDAPANMGGMGATVVRL